MVGFLLTMALGTSVQVPRGVLGVALLVSLAGAGWLLFAPEPGQAS